MRAIRRFGTLAIAFTLLSAMATAASGSQRANKYFTVSGIVLKIDKVDRTMLVADRASNEKYLIEVPEGATFKITFGRYMQLNEPALEDVSARERVKIRCFRGDTEHLALLDDGQPVVVVTAVQ